MLEDYSDEPQVMIIDDVPATRAILRDMLAEMGLTEVAEAGDGKEALAQLKRHRAQLIICDHVMDTMSGLDLINQLRNHPYLVDIPLVVVSSCSDGLVIETALELGADDFLIKPVSFARLQQTIKEVLMRRRDEPVSAS